MSFTSAMIATIASAGDLYWRTDGATGGTWTDANWSNPATSTGGSGWTAGANAIFTANSSLTFVTLTEIGNVTVAPGKKVSVTAAGTLSTQGMVRIFDVGTDASLEWRSQDVSSGSAAGFIKNGDGIWNMGANGNSYSGGFTLNAGKVIVSGSRSFGGGVININGGSISTSNAQALEIGGKVNVGSDFIFSNESGSNAKVTFSGEINLMTGIRKITQNAGTDRILSGVISNGGLTKAGTGVLVVLGANTYTGKTTVSAGTLKLGTATTISASSEIAVSSGAILDASPAGLAIGQSQILSGSGTVIGAVTMNGTHSPGGAGGAGSQSITGSLAYGNGSIFEWNLDQSSTTSGYDTVAVSGTVTGATADAVFRVVLNNGLDFSQPFWSTPDSSKTWPLASIFGKSLSSGGFQAVEASRDVSQYGRFTISSTELTWSAVPEPSNILVGLLLGCGLLRRRRVSAA